MNTHAASVNLSVVIPLFNESRCLKDNVEQTLAFLETLEPSHELVLVDDGSTDSTPELCRVLASAHPAIRVLGGGPNRGKGFAVRTGMLGARGDHRIFMDADLAVPLDYLRPMLDAMRGGAAVAIASRHAEGASIKVAESPLREFMGKVFRRMALTGLGLPVTDVTCGLKGFSRQSCQAVFSRARIDRWTYDAEILLLARKLGFGVTEIPIQWFHSEHSAVRVGKDAVQSLVDMGKIFWWSKTGVYGPAGSKGAG